MSSEPVLVKIDQGVATITLNRPTKKNALSNDMYKKIIEVLGQCANDEKVAVAVLTGKGEYYSSGNDLSNFLNPSGSMEEMAEQARLLLYNFVDSFITFPKPLIAAVNGPAIGVTVTTLALCDFVYAAESATFSTPFSALGQTPEGLSSYIFPRIMGHSNANQLLLLGRTITAKQAEAWGFVSEVFPNDKLHDNVQLIAQKMAELPRNTVLQSKKLIRSHNIQKLQRVNKHECDLLAKMWVSDDCINAITNFMMKQSKPSRKSKL